MKGLHQVSHYPRETAIQIDCNQLGSIPNTNPHFPRRGHVGSPLVQLRYTFHGFDQRRTTRDNQLPGCLGPACPWAQSGSPHILTTIQSVHSYKVGPGLSWATRLRGRNELSDQLSDRHAFNLVRSANNGTVLNRHRRIHMSQPTIDSVWPRFTLPHGSFPR